jgi:uncharacterized protein (TIGR00369 family)
MFSMDNAAHVMATALPEFMRELGIAIESLGTEGVRLRLPRNDKICREGGIVSGQALASLADTSMVFAVWATLGEHKPIGTIDLHVSYLRPAASSDVLAHAEVVRLGRTLAFARVTMTTTTSSRPVATAVATFALPA